MPSYRRCSRAVLFTLAAALCSHSMLHAATAVSQYGITWTWQEDRPIGQFATGDYWVVGPITLTGISPASVTVDGTVKKGVVAHGSMVNPIAGLWPAHGLDSRLGGYSEALNMARQNGAALSASNTRAIAPGSSICSTISRSFPDGSNQHTFFTDFAVLTVVDAAPAPGSFRPPYLGTDKTIRWNKSQLDYTILRNLPRPEGMQAPTSAPFTRPWLLISMEFNAARDFCAQNNQIEYDRDMAWVIGIALLELHQDCAKAEKELAYIRLVQYAIDLYGAVKYGQHVEGGKTYPIGQGNTATKGAVVLAALALNDPDMKSLVDAANKIPNPWKAGLGCRWGPDGACYVSATTVGGKANDMYLTEGRPRYNYTAQMIGLPEWLLDEDGSLHTGSGSNWGLIYRNVRYSGMASMTLAMHLVVGATAAWNRQPFFDYMDRAFATYTHSSDDPTHPAYVKTWWNAYRAKYGGPVWTGTPVSGIGWIRQAGDVLTIEYTDNVTTGSGGNGGLVVTASGGGVTATYASGNGGTQRVYSLSRTILAGETVSYTYTQPGNGIEAATGGADVVTAKAVSVVNYSAATPAVPAKAKP